MSALYDLARKKFLDGDIDWLVDDIKCSIIDTNDYSVNLTTDEFFDDIPGAAVVATSGNFTGKTTTDGVADADNVVLSSVTGDSCEAIVIFKDTGIPSTSPLIAYIDAGTGLPITPNGGNITIEWSNGSNKIFKL